MNHSIPRERVAYDVVIVGGGIAGLSASIKIKQLSPDISVVVLEKGAEIGSHILSGAVIDIAPLQELLPDIVASDFPFDSSVKKDNFYYLTKNSAYSIPHFLVPKFMNNHGNYITSLGKLCQFLASTAEQLGVEIYTGMAASELIYENDILSGVVAGVFGLDADGTPKPDFQAGLELVGKYIVFAEGTRGSLSKQLIQKYALDKHSCPQKYGIGFKEIWEIPPSQFTQGRIIHTLGQPLSNKAGGGGFLYMAKNNQVYVGMVVHLDYENPSLSPYDEFQQMKHHPLYADILSGGRRIAYGARAINEGGLQSIPQLSFPGGALIGCSAGFVNLPRIKGTHNAIKSAIICATNIVKAISSSRQNDTLTHYDDDFKNSGICSELFLVRNVKPLWSKFGLFGGIILGGLDMWTNTLLGRSVFGTLKHTKKDCETLNELAPSDIISYPKPDGILSFDKLTNVSFTATNHAENQPNHLILKNPDIPIQYNLVKYGEPARIYCPAGVYEVVTDTETQLPQFKINSQNCIHCKTCDIKDPCQNINWTTPEGGGGPNYSGM